MRSNSKINGVEVFALSLASMTPTGSIAGNTGPAAKFAGVNLPISFLVASVAMLLVAVGFYEMSKRIATDGSIYAYNRRALGEHWGFISGWIITLSYLVIGISLAALSGTSLAMMLKNFGIDISPEIAGLGLLFVMWIILDFGIKITSNLSLITEAVAIFILITLSCTILVKGGPDGTNVQPFIPQVSFSGIGQGVVYTVLCFVGFEVACTVATRTKNPKKTIPRALLSTIIGGAIIFVFVSYAMVIGFGTTHAGMSQLATSQSPLDAIAIKYMGPKLAILIDLAIFISAFGAATGCTNAGIYMVYAISEKHYLPSTLSHFNYHRDAPCHSVNVVLIIDLLIYLLIAFRVGVNKTYLYFMTLGALCMIVIYILACIGCFVYFRKQHGHGLKRSFFKHYFAPIVAFIILLFPLASNLYPVPAFPLNIMPYVVLVWGIIGYFMSVHKTKQIAAKKNNN